MKCGSNFQVWMRLKRNPIEAFSKVTVTVYFSIFCNVKFGNVLFPLSILSTFEGATVTIVLSIGT